MPLCITSQTPLPLCTLSNAWLLQTLAPFSSRLLFTDTSHPSFQTNKFLNQFTTPSSLYQPISGAQKICNNLPSYFWNRKQICREIFDLNHQTLCTEKKFHLLDYTSCICLGCGEQMSHYHHYFCTSFDHNS